MPCKDCGGEHQGIEHVVDVALDRQIMRGLRRLTRAMTIMSDLRVLERLAAGRPPLFGLMDTLEDVISFWVDCVAPQTASENELAGLLHKAVDKVLRDRKIAVAQQASTNAPTQ
jgi:hypothetical protein